MPEFRGMAGAGGGWIVAGLLAALAASALPAAEAAAAADQRLLQIATDHADGAYATGESVTWTVRIVGGAGGGPALTPAFTVASGKGVLTNGVLRFVDGTAVVTARLDRPGVLELKVDHATPWRKSFGCAAAVAWREIKSTVPEPADFDAFWKRKLDELSAVPMNPLMEFAHGVQGRAERVVESLGGGRAASHEVRR